MFLFGLLAQEIVRAENSRMRRWILNRLLLCLIPFNRPHGVKVRSIGELDCSVTVPLSRLNRNHLGSMHACVLATAGEYASGLLAIRGFPIADYRLLCRRLTVTYERQARTSVTAWCRIEPSFLDVLRRELATKGVSTATFQSELFDEAGVLVCRAEAEWHIKRLSQVDSLSIG